MDRSRVVVTGMGVVSCFGNDVDLFYQKLLSGESGVSAIGAFPCEEFSTRIAAPVFPYDFSQYLDKKQARRVDKYIAYALTAGKLAHAQAALGASHLDVTRCGVIIGSGKGGMGIFTDNIHALEGGPKKVSPFLIPYILTNMGGGLLGEEFGFMGPNYSVSTACATGNYAIAMAAEHIRRGECDLMLCGGAEAPILPISLAGFCSIKALSQRNENPKQASRPWDRGRDGFVLGEGAGVLVLESLEHARARGVPILAEYLGGAFTCDAHHMTEPHPEGKGVVLCLRRALADAHVEVSEVNYINAHATSTLVGDKAELVALLQVFTEDPSRIAINATKSMTGHSLGAAGGLEAIATVKAIMEGVIHPTINLEDPEPDLKFFAPRKGVEWPVRVAISNSFGFGGHNAVLGLGQPPR